MWRRLLLLVFLCGCENQPSAPNKTTNATNLLTNPPPHLDHAQPKLRTMKLWLGPKEITAELAISRTEIATGMMFRDKMEENEGMLFIFAQPVQVSFYMKNTYVPLSVAFIDAQGAIINIADMQPHSEQSHCASRPALYALEMAQGWFAERGVKPGTKLGGLDKLR